MKQISLLILIINFISRNLKNFTHPPPPPHSCPQVKGKYTNCYITLLSHVGAAWRVSPNWSQETMTSHSSNCFSIVWGQGHHLWHLFRAAATRPLIRLQKRSICNKLKPSYAVGNAPTSSYKSRRWKFSEGGDWTIERVVHKPIT